MSSEVENQGRENVDGRSWGSFWVLMVMQCLQSFNVNAVKFMLIALGAYLLTLGEAPKGVEHLVTMMLVLPYLLFAPLAGWMADRFAKHRVLRWTAWFHVVSMGVVAFALWGGNMIGAVLGFFLMATQCAAYSPAKYGVIKEWVGEKKLGFASGVTEGTVILAILGGQMVGSVWFDSLLQPGVTGYAQALEPFMGLGVLAVLSVVCGYGLKGTEAGGEVAGLSWGVATQHVRDLRAMLGDRELRLCGLGVGFFWGYGGLLGLLVLQIAEMQNGGGGKGTGRSMAELWIMAALGIAVGSVVAGLLSRARIERGLSALGGVLMVLAAGGLALVSFQSWEQKLLLLGAGFGGAVFLVPLQAVIQDKPAVHERGMMISASNFLNSSFGLLFPALQLVMKYGLRLAMPVQFVVVAVLCACMTLWVGWVYRADVVHLLGRWVLGRIYRVKRLGLENLPERGGVLLLPNHVTFADGFFVSLGCPRRVRFVMDAGFMKKPVIGWFCRLFEIIPIEQGQPRTALRAAIEALEGGDVVCLFPEGQLTRTGGLSPLQRGFAFFAKLSSVPLVPVWCDGAWGSIFSFEGGRFFKKRPSRLPYRLSVSYGAELSREKLGLCDLRDALYGAGLGAVEGSVEGVESRFERNAYQVAQLNGWPREGEMFGLEGDEEIPVEVVEAFCARYGVRFSRRVELGGGIWVGGEKTREKWCGMGVKPEGFRLFDFSVCADEELGEGVSFGCLACGGLVVAMSQADPELVVGAVAQHGRKAGSFGRVLAGFFLDEERQLWCGLGMGEGVDAAGWSWDEEGFVRRKS